MYLLTKTAIETGLQQLLADQNTQLLRERGGGEPATAEGN